MASEAWPCAQRRRPTLDELDAEARLVDREMPPTPAPGLQERERVAGRRVAFVLSGGNVDADVFARVLAGESLADVRG